ncbi:hypothetical protein FQZ97_970620 [compost metagenome]
MPKSSIEKRMPRALSSRILSSTSSALVISMVSVTSSLTRAAATPCRPRICCTRSTKSGAMKLMAEKFTAMLTPRSASSQACSCRHTASNT